MVDGGEAIGGLREAMNARQRLVGENRPLIDLNRNNDAVGAAKRIADLIVQFDVGMVLRQQIRKIRVDFEIGNLQRKEPRHEDDDREINDRVCEQNFFGKTQKLIHGAYFRAPVIRLFVERDTQI